MNRELSSPELHTPRGSAQVILTDSSETAYICGQIATEPDGTILGLGDLRTQTAVALRNVERAVKAAGGSVEDLVKVNYFVVAPDVASLAEFEEGFALAAAWGVRLPLKAAGTLLRVVGLADDQWLIEIDAVAAIDGRDTEARST